jgi:hypothetical protein
VAERSPDDDGQPRLAGRLGQRRQLDLHRIEQSRLQVQVVNGVGRQAEFRKDQQLDPGFTGLADQFEMLLGIGRWVRDVHDRRSGTDTDESMCAGAVEGMKLGQGAVLRVLLI